MLLTTKAIVFSSVKYAEADLIVCCFTEDAGLKSYLLRNILKSKKGALKPSLFQPLTQLEIVASHKNKGTLEFIKEAKVLNPYKSLHTHILKASMVLFLAEILKHCIKEEEVNRNLYSFLETHFNWLDLNDQIANFHILFLLKLSGHLGFYPNISDIDSRYFNIFEGNFQQKSVSAYCVEGSAVEGFKQFFGIQIDDMRNVKLTKETRMELLQLMLSYYQFHVQGFRNPKSLLILNQLFL